MSLLAHARIQLAALALAGLGFWLVPGDPALPALLLTAAALPLALLTALAFLLLERREAARARLRADGGRRRLGAPGRRPKQMGTPSLSRPQVPLADDSPHPLYARPSGGRLERLWRLSLG